MIGAIRFHKGLDRVVYNGEVGAAAGDRAAQAGREVFSSRRCSPPRSRAMMSREAEPQDSLMLTDDITDLAAKMAGKVRCVGRRNN
jgi:hypothetical protein